MAYHLLLSLPCPHLPPLVSSFTLHQAHRQASHCSSNSPCTCAHPRSFALPIPVAWKALSLMVAQFTDSCSQGPIFASGLLWPLCEVAAPLLSSLCSLPSVVCSFLVFLPSWKACSPRTAALFWSLAFSRYLAPSKCAINTRWGNEFGQMDTAAGRLKLAKDITSFSSSL